MRPLESVPNVSAGRDPGMVEAIAGAFAGAARLLDVHSDADHNRSVFTLLGEDDALVDGLVAGTREALARVDLRAHEGVHPRIGAVDVVPLVPLVPQDEARAHAAAVAYADRVAGELGLPVFFYGRLTAAAHPPAFFRRGGPAELQRRIDAGELAPDRGPATLDPRAGGVLVGVRKPLVAFNVNLASDDLALAREIAAAIRERDGGLPGVRALGLALPSAGLVQVSMNLEDWELTAPHEVVERIRELAGARGVELAGGELIGLLPVGAAAAATRSALALPAFEPRQLLELRLLDAVLAGGGAAAEAPASGTGAIS